MYDGYYRRGGSVFGAFLLGGLVGAVLGLLFAPRSGKETRDMIAEQGRRVLGRGRRALRDRQGARSPMSPRPPRRPRPRRARSSAPRSTRRAGVCRRQVAKSADAAKGKIDEVTPAAKEAVDKAAAGAKSGMTPPRQRRRRSGLRGQEGRDRSGRAVADVKAAVDDAVAAAADKKGDNPLPEV